MLPRGFSPPKSAPAARTQQGVFKRNSARDDSLLAGPFVLPAWQSAAPQPLPTVPGTPAGQLFAGVVVGIPVLIKTDRTEAKGMEKTASGKGDVEQLQFPRGRTSTKYRTSLECAAIRRPTCTRYVFGWRGHWHELLHIVGRVRALELEEYPVSPGEWQHFIRARSSTRPYWYLNICYCLKDNSVLAYLSRVLFFKAVNRSECNATSKKPKWAR